MTSNAEQNNSQLIVFMFSYKSNCKPNALCVFNVQISHTPLAGWRDTWL